MRDKRQSKSLRFTFEAFDHPLPILLFIGLLPSINDDDLVLGWPDINPDGMRIHPSQM